jgi:predicted nucleic acid-binding protein
VSHLLDTNVVSELRKPRNQANKGVQIWARSRAAETLFLSVITVLELAIGVARMERRDPHQGRRLRSWLSERVLVAFADRILPIDLAVAQRAAALHTPGPRPERDALIAATAKVHGLRIVTRNVKDFAPMGVDVVNPWS